MTPVEIITALSTLLGVIFAFFKWLLPFMLKYYKTRRTQQFTAKFEEGLKAILKVNDWIEELHHHAKITQVILLEITNGGDMPQPGSQMFGSVIQVRKNNSDGLRDVPAEMELREKYNRIRLDDAYIRVIIHAQSNGFYAFQTEKEATSILRDFYINEQINHSEIFHIYTDGFKKKMFILSIGTIDSKADFNQPATRSFINTAVSGIRSNFQTYRES